MVVVLIKVLVACFGSVLFSCLYQLFFSYSNYDGKAEYVPSPIFPLFVIVVFILGVVFAKQFLEVKWFFTVMFSVLLVVLFITSSNFIDNKYGYILEHYYGNTPNTNLIGLKDYKIKKGNYLLIKKELEKQGIDVNSINVGYTDKFDWRTTEEYNSYTKATYSINDDFYIIFDWVNNEIVTSVKSKELENFF